MFWQSCFLCMLYCVSLWSFVSFHRYCHSLLWPSCVSLQLFFISRNNSGGPTGRSSVSETWINLYTAHFLDILCTVRTGLCRRVDWTARLPGQVRSYTIRAPIGPGVIVGSVGTPVSPWLRKTPFWSDSERQRKDREAVVLKVIIHEKPLLFCS